MLLLLGWVLKCHVSYKGGHYKPESQNDNFHRVRIELSDSLQTERTCLISRLTSKGLKADKSSLTQLAYIRNSPDYPFPTYTKLTTKMMYRMKKLAV